MAFKTDKQTLEDLNIYSRAGTDSIYTLFNHTSTQKGAAILEDMFRYPLSDPETINQRSTMISYHAKRSGNFPFRVELFDLVELYLDNTDERSRLSTQKQSLEKKLGNLIAADSMYKTISSGIISLIAIVQKLTSFIADAMAEPDTPYCTDRTTDEIAGILDMEPFCTLIREKAQGKFDYEKIAMLDRQLRFGSRGNIKKVLQYIYQLDVYVAVAKTAQKHGFNFAAATSKGEHTTVLEEFYHPLLTGAVANSLRICPESNLIFLTGANMAGKSTFMKSFGITLYLAHMGFPVPAKHLSFSVLDGIYSTINLPDNLGTGASHFYAEVLRIKKMAKELSTGANILVIFDELFRGTNVKDAYEATIAITSAFAKKADSIFVISTHIIEAGEVLKEQWSNINFKYLPTEMNGTTPVYTYRLNDGITADRHGMLIINNEGILDILREGKK